MNCNDSTCYFHGVRYRRQLPHWFPDGRPIFLTWRLFGSISFDELRRIRIAAEISGSKKFGALDHALDRSVCGPKWLAEPAVAEIICTTLRRSANERRHFELHAFVVMPNHVHILITPAIAVPCLMNVLKTSTAKQANQRLQRSGSPFWQSESFDHWSRNDLETEKIRRYIENNPVKAGLAAQPDAWPWSSAAPRWSAKNADMSAGVGLGVG